MEREAHFSPDRRYRFCLRRRWGRGKHLVMVMLNPSRADARRDDPTTTFCVNRAREKGFGSYEAVNLFALVDPSPDALRRVADPIGPGNDAWIERAAARADRIVVAWGRHGVLQARDQAVLALLRGRKLHCFGRNADGSPRFPRALPTGVRHVPFVPPALPLD
ncbi:MAG: DUF1643 domain-containing protein [Planctomycetota bacterium]|nr:DUF1643 domain-containing protein [Planctomycetota bacterium]